MLQVLPVGHAHARAAGRQPGRHRGGRRRAGAALLAPAAARPRRAPRSPRDPRDRRLIILRLFQTYVYVYSINLFLIMLSFLYFI